MSTSTTLLGPDDLRLLLRQVIDANPNSTNPTIDGDTCIYTDPNNLDRHCIIGQLATNQGWTLPHMGSIENRAEARVIAKTYKWPVDNAGLNFLREIQEEADGGFLWWQVEV
jgi:hypothetical protein